ncbi:MAG: TrkH family potassium uptake protein [Candidatus Kapabacteria bacterium]|nr:TrkH family potassium uptake protein [Ignavibacteriota bacterium]MCW5886324.1 TrkH family potassium uptake protein [Candidatus Kapabacteria bacterium]
MLLPVPFSIYYQSTDINGLLLSSGICLVLGIAGIFLLPKNPQEIRAKEGFAVVSLGWLTFALFGSLPYLLGGATSSITDAFFETMSGVTTTGATIFSNVEVLPHGVLFWRSLTHWFGGMGIIVLTVAVLPFLGIGGMQLFKAEVPGPVVDKLSPRIAETAKILWGVYLFFTVLQTILLMLGGMNLFDALCHSFGTMATGGFSTKNASVGAYSSAYIDYVITAFMIIAGTNFALLYWLLRGKVNTLFNNGEFRFYIIIIAVATIIIGIHLFFNHTGNVFDSLRYAVFQVVAIITTTGFGTADYEEWSASSQLILFGLMFVGGCAGSTGGGFKVIRVIILIKFISNELVRLIHPQAIVFVKFGNLSLDRKVLINVAGFFMIYVMIAVFGTILISFFGIDILTSMGAVAATLNNIGPGLGAVGPTENYAHLPDVVKWILSFLMMLGRLEIYTVIILLIPAYWRR